MTRSNPRNQSLTGQSFISSNRETTPLLPSPYFSPSPTMEPDVGGEQACKFVFTLGRIQFLFIFSKAVRPVFRLQSASPFYELLLRLRHFKVPGPPIQAWLPRASSNRPTAPSPILPAPAACIGGSPGPAATFSAIPISFLRSQCVTGDWMKHFQLN